MLSLTDRRGRVYIRQPLTCLPFPPIIHRLLKLRTVITLTSHCHNQSTIECPTLSLLSSLDGLPTLLNVETKLNSNRTATCQGSLRMTMSSSKSSAAVFAVATSTRFVWKHLALPSLVTRSSVPLSRLVPNLSTKWGSASVSVVRLGLAEAVLGARTSLKTIAPNLKTLSCPPLKVKPSHTPRAALAITTKPRVILPLRSLTKSLPSMPPLFFVLV
ncbi:mannitol dehydrogenase [Cryptococcus neoformans 125.91]|nr:mannitol dehydrogenase [Cryptococcus neoformans var. grubii 125.91]